MANSVKTTETYYSRYPVISEDLMKVIGLDKDTAYETTTLYSRPGYPTDYVYKVKTTDRPSTGSRTRVERGEGPYNTSVLITNTYGPNEEGAPYTVPLSSDTLWNGLYRASDEYLKMHPEIKKEHERLFLSDPNKEVLLSGYDMTVDAYLLYLSDLVRVGKLKLDEKKQGLLNYFDYLQNKVNDWREQNKRE